MSSKTVIKQLASVPDLPELENPTLPFVSVLIPCRNEENYIGKCLDSILANDYPRDRMEILVLDGMSDDRTREIVKEYSERHDPVRLLDNPKKNIPAAMNAGISNARGDTVLRMDAHSTCQNNHIRLCVEYQKKSGVENVGGILKILPSSKGEVARAIVLALGHRFGSGNALIKTGVNQPTWSDSVAFGCYRKELFSRIGLFDERLICNEDTDINMRILDAGGRILLLPEVVVTYYADSRLKDFWKHNFADGVWATYVLKFGSKGWSWRHWVPLAFVLTLLGSLASALVIPPAIPLFLSVLGLYAVVNIGVSLGVAIRERSVRQCFLLPLVFAIRHFAHGLGALFGLLLIAFPGQHWKGRRGMKA